MTIKKAFPLFILTLLLASPLSMALAKDNGKENGDNKDKKEYRQEDRSCLRAFGHLVAPGWIKLHGEIDVKTECNLPFGISKKFGDKASTTPKTTDTVAPVISGIESKVRLTDATISWKISERAKSTIFFATTTGVSASSTSTTQNSKSIKSFEDGQRVTLRGLTAGTKYYAVIRAEDKAGNVTQSAEFSFTTQSATVVSDTTAPVISTVVTASGINSIAVGWKTNEPSTSVVFYSTSTPVNTGATTTASMRSDLLVKDHLIIVPSLSATTTYYMVVQSKDSTGNIQSTAEFSAITK